MEKFTKWSDKSGVNPFVPCKPKLPKSTISRAVYVTFLSLIAAPKLLIVLLFTSLLFICQCVLSPLGLIVITVSCWLFESNSTGKSPMITASFGAISIISFGDFIGMWTPTSFLYRILNQIFTRISLLLLGVSFQPSLGVFRRLGLDPKLTENAKLHQLQYAPGGDIIICNLTNALEILYLEIFCRPLYVFPCKQNDTYNCVEAQFFQAIYIAAYGTGGDTTTTPTGLKTLSAVVESSKKKRRPIVLFIESVRTNGDGVLEFPVQVMESLLSGSSSGSGSETNDMIVIPPVHLAGFIYPPPDKLSPATPVGSPWVKLLWLAGTTGWGWRTLYTVPLVCIPSVATPRPFTTSGVSSTDNRSGNVTDDNGSSRNRRSIQQLSTWLEQIRDLFAQLIKKNKVSLNVDDLNSFRKYYSLLVSGKNSEANAYADTRKKH
eukprot:gene4169-8287_t